MLCRERNAPIKDKNSKEKIWQKNLHNNSVESELARYARGLRPKTEDHKSPDQPQLSERSGNPNIVPPVLPHPEEEFRVAAVRRFDRRWRFPPDHLFRFRGCTLKRNSAGLPLDSLSKRWRFSPDRRSVFSAES